MRYCIYLRKSRADMEAEAKGEGETLARHEKALLEFAGKRKLEINKIYREVVSGETIAARPVMRELLSEVEHGDWDGVLVMEVERLARGDTIDQGIVARAFQFSATKIITPLKTYDPNDEFDEEYFEFGLFMSRREYKTINRRMQRGRIASVKEGKYVANRAPYGYVRSKLEHDKGYTLAPHPDEAQIVRLIFSLFTLGEKGAEGAACPLSAPAIAQKLNSAGIPSPKNGTWSAPSVRDILRNPVYCGRIRWNFRPTKKVIVSGRVIKKRPRAQPTDCIVADGLHEAIVDADTWALAQNRLAKNTQRPVACGKTVKNPLAGLILCGKCGCSMVRRPYPKHEDTLLCPQGCGNVSSALRLVEERIVQTLEALSAEYQPDWEATVSELSRKEEKNDTTLIETAAGRLAKEELVLRRQLAAAHDLLEQSVYSIEEFRSRREKLEEAMRENQRRALTLRRTDDGAEGQTQTPKALPHYGTFAAFYDALPTPQAKNDVLHELLCRVVYRKTVNGRWHNPPDDFELQIYPNLPVK